MTDNRTTELLREGLTEHGIEWRSGLEGVTFVGDWCFVEYDNGRLAATCEPVLTPDQAIAATVGSGMCEQVLTDCDDGLIPPFTAHCSACGAEWGFTPKYCHNCGAMVTGTRDDRKVVKQ